MDGLLLGLLLVCCDTLAMNPPKPGSRFRGESFPVDDMREPTRGDTPASTGHGGWPMSVWLTPDLKPVFGGTYFPPEGGFGRPGFRQLLEILGAKYSIVYIFRKHQRFLFEHFFLPLGDGNLKFHRAADLQKPG
ncbi:unnamed protein product [Notodromas monacha]|uniref:Spermatogenesis-associated protein 20-like TRX domain-containing protein n=1 Tax=Notodromas monacha TaxID=399045 RepID=A0A7R9BX22_9CRUS|nr:unnamed protein product [Notodromas monacha]CAG0921793.1 unnamed protein product [Notodromas monacha]